MAARAGPALDGAPAGSPRAPLPQLLTGEGGLGAASPRSQASPAPLASPLLGGSLLCSSPPSSARCRPGRDRTGAVAASNWKLVLGLAEEHDPLEEPIVVRSARNLGSKSSCGSMASLPPAHLPYASCGGSSGLGSVDVVWQRPRRLAHAGGRGSEQDARMQVPPEITPCEGWQRVEWKLGQFEEDRHILDLKYRGMQVVRGQAMASPSFKVMGEEGFLRFWPNGYYNKTQVPRIFHDAQSNRGGLRKSCWCAIALIMPAGAHLRLRFYVGSSRSEVKEVYWSSHSILHQLWMPEDPRPADLGELVVGVEVLRNFRQLRPGEAKPSAARSAAGPAAAGPWPAAPLRQRPLAEATARMAEQLMSARSRGGSDKLPSPRFGITLGRP